MANFKNRNHALTFGSSIKNFLRGKPQDCCLYSEDGSQFKIHKEILGQTAFLRKIISDSAKDCCCVTVDIFCPCSDKELGLLVKFLYTGKIVSDDVDDLSKTIDNLQEIFGFPNELSLKGSGSCLPLWPEGQDIPNDALNHNVANFSVKKQPSDQPESSCHDENDNDTNLQDPEIDPLEDATTTTEFQNELPPEGQVLVNCNSNHNVSSISIKEETFDQDENIGVAQGENGKDINSTEPDVDLPVEHFPNETDNQENATDKAFFDEGNLKNESNIEDSEDEVEILGQTGTEKDSKKRNIPKTFKCDECEASFFSKQGLRYHVEEKFCDGYKPSLKRKRDTPVKHIKIVLPKLKLGSGQSNIEPDFSQNKKGNIPVSDLHREKKKSKEVKFNCKNCFQLVLDCQYSSFLKFCMKCSGLIAKTGEGYNCSLCSFKSSSEFSVFQHIKKTHLNNRERFECGRCCEKLLIRAYVRHVEPCKRYYDFIEKIDDDNYKCKLCLNITYKKRFSLYKHLKQHTSIRDVETNLDNRLPDPEVLQNDAKANDAMEEKE